MTVRRLYRINSRGVSPGWRPRGTERPFTTSELDVLPLPAQGGEDTFSQRLPVAVGSEEGVEEIMQLNGGLDLEIQSRGTAKGSSRASWPREGP